jgi:hypothetical protein
MRYRFKKTGMVSNGTSFFMDVFDKNAGGLNYVKGDYYGGADRVYSHTLNVPLSSL